MEYIIIILTLILLLIIAIKKTSCPSHQLVQLV